MQARKARKMTIHLTPGSIGVKADQSDTLQFAHDYGYEAVEPNSEFLANVSEDRLKQIRDFMRSRSLVWGSAGLRVDFRAAEELFQEGMKTLPAHAKGLQRAGVTRVGTWLRPTHDKLTARANFDQHVRRLSAIASVLDDHGIRFGLEYVGPKLSWSAQKFPFVHTMAETKELIAATGKRNLGFVLDSWHWYTAQETKEDLLTLKNSDIVSCDLNDAPAGLTVDKQVDSQRELPCATGVIDLKGFLSALVEIGYDGPVRPEPFNAALRAMPKEQILTVTAEAMKKAFALVA
ncbi:MAG: sugar phosphate isomerase/epimerase [Bryobacterales bacterium]|nr:sugar phosphate isomerase/epimerase [Bryobacterales bacterium]